MTGLHVRSDQAIRTSRSKRVPTVRMNSSPGWRVFPKPAGISRISSSRRHGQRYRSAFLLRWRWQSTTTAIALIPRGASHRNWTNGDTATSGARSRPGVRAAHSRPPWYPSSRRSGTPRVVESSLGLTYLPRWKAPGTVLLGSRAESSAADNSASEERTYKILALCPVQFEHSVRVQLCTHLKDRAGSAKGGRIPPAAQGNVYRHVLARLSISG